MSFLDNPKLKNYTSRFHFAWKKYTYRFQLTHSILGFTPMEIFVIVAIIIGISQT